MADAVVIGGGHNGLTAALLLARQGYTVELFEATDHVGGACVTKRIVCGCRVNEAANAFGMVPAHILNVLGLLNFGDDVVVPDPQIVVLGEPGNCVALYTSPERTVERLPHHLAGEGLAFSAFVKDLDLAATALKPFLLDPQALVSNVFQAMEDCKPGLGDRFLTGNLRATLDYYFRTDFMKAACVASAPLFPSLTSEEGTSFALTYAAQSCNRGISGWGVVKGGIGRFAESLAIGLKEAGCMINLNSPVKRIRVHDGAVAGVEVGSRFVQSRVVVAAINPVTALSHLFQPSDLEPELLDAIQLRRTQGGCAKLNVLLDGPMDRWLAIWPALQNQHHALFVYCPSLNFLDHAYNDFTSGLPSSQLYLEIAFQGDPGHGMTCGEHTPISVFVLYVPHPETRSRSISRVAIEQTIRTQMESLFPSFNDHVSWSSLLLPEDIEGNYGMLLGNVDHGSMSSDNLFEKRPVSRDLWRSKKPKGLVLGSAGRYPGGLVTAVPGYLAHIEAVQELNGNS